jgi:hypothetical protein
MITRTDSPAHRHLGRGHRGVDGWHVGECIPDHRRVVGWYVGGCTLSHGKGGVGWCVGVLMCGRVHAYTEWLVGSNGCVHAYTEWLVGSNGRVHTYTEWLVGSNGCAG